MNFALLHKKLSNIGFNADKTAMFQIKFSGEIESSVPCVSFCVAVLQVKPALSNLYFIFPTRHKMKKTMIIGFPFLFSLISHQSFSCTIFYTAKGNMILAGNYECNLREVQNLPLV